MTIHEMIATAAKNRENPFIHESSKRDVDNNFGTSNSFYDSVRIHEHMNHPLTSGFDHSMVCMK